MIRIAVCDDNREDCYEERDCLQTVLNEYGMDYKIDLFFDTERLYKALHDRLFDLIVSDTFLDGRDMFDFVRMLREEKYPIRVIFVSGREDCAVRAYQVFALDCFSKPLTPLRLRQIVDYLSCLHRLPRRLYLPAKNGESYRVCENDIRYIEVFHNDVCIHLSDRSIVCRSTLTGFLKRLSGASFIRCHQSYAVNLSHTAAIRRYLAELDGGDTVPVSKKYYAYVRDRFRSRNDSTSFGG